MDPGKIVFLKITQEKIREEAETFREQHKFDVSAEVIGRRLRKENVMSLIGK